MIKLEKTGSANLEILGEGELTRVVGGHGHHHYGSDGNQHSRSRHQSNGGHNGAGNSRGFGSPTIILQVTINNVNSNTQL